MLAVGSAWALGVELGHETVSYLVNGKSDYSPTIADASSPRFRLSYIGLYPSPDEGNSLDDQLGYINLSTSAPTTIEHWNKNAPDERFTTSKDFELIWDVDYYYIVDDSNEEVYFTTGAETGLSGQDFSVSLGTVDEKSKFAAIRTTEQQIKDKVVPYVELVTNGTKTTGVKWRFVDPANTSAALARGNNSDISQVYRIRIYDKSDNSYTATPMISTPYGQKLEGEIVLEAPLDTSAIDCVRIGFEYADGTAQSGGVLKPYLFYQWYFYARTAAVDGDTDGNDDEVGIGGDENSDNEVNNGDGDAGVQESGGGGCSSGTLVFALPLAGIIAVFPRTRARRLK
jgi:hypothetical protein